MFIGPGANPKWATDVRKNLGMKARILKSGNSSIRSILLEINGSTVEITNIDAPSGKEATKLRAYHKPQTKTIVSGEFNSYHAMWYADMAADYATSIWKSKINATALVTWATKQNLILQNDPGTFTHFPHSGQRPRILELRFSSGQGTTMIDGWSCDAGSGGNSDHAMTVTSLNIRPHDTSHEECTTR